MNQVSCTEPPRDSLFLRKIVPLSGVLATALLLWQFTQYLEWFSVAAERSPSRAVARSRPPEHRSSGPGSSNSAESSGAGTALRGSRPSSASPGAGGQRSADSRPRSSAAGENPPSLEDDARAPSVPRGESAPPAASMLLHGDGGDWQRATDAERREVCALAVEWLEYGSSVELRAKRAGVFHERLDRFYENSRFADVKIADILPLIHATANRDELLESPAVP